MKYFSNILATTIVALFLLSFGMKSEAVGQILNDCDSDPCYQEQDWVVGFKKYTYGPQPACSDCWVEIHYKTRNNSTNPNCQSLPPVEFQLEYIVVSGSCYYAPCSEFTPFDMQEAYQEAVVSLLSEWGYAPIYPSDCGPVFESFTVINCFREDFDLEGNRIIRICDAKGCCKLDLQLCLNNGNVEVNSVVRANSENCSSDPLYPDECKTICNWIDEAIVPKKVLEYINKSEVNPLNIFPNPINSDVLTFSFNKNVEIENISILTNDGKIIEINKNSLSNENLINIENYSNGYYMLIIKGSNGKNYYSQFIIKK